MQSFDRPPSVPLLSVNMGGGVMEKRLGHGRVAARTSGSQPREPGFESTCSLFEALAISFVPLWHS